MSNSKIEDPVIQKAVKDALKEYSAELLKIETHKEHVKAILTSIVDVSGLDRKQVNKIARFYHQQSLAAASAEFSETRELYEKILGESV